jgi:hypothetical protein
MKKTIYTLMTALLLFSLATQAQVGVGLPASSVNASALLEVSTTAKGFLPPRMTEAQRNSIASPAAGLILWCSNCGTSGEIQVYNGSSWTNFVGGAASAAPLVVGQSYQGGIIAYILNSGDNGYDASIKHGLIAATQDQGTSITWGSSISTGATSLAIGMGSSNTSAIISAMGNTGNYAAKSCRDYRGGNYSDWYLPTWNELYQLYVNRGAIGGFSTGDYWSSSQNGSPSYDGAFTLMFSNGNLDNDYRSHGINVRAVRSF